MTGVHFVLGGRLDCRLKIGWQDESVRRLRRNVRFAGVKDRFRGVMIG